VSFFKKICWSITFTAFVGLIDFVVGMFEVDLEASAELARGNIDAANSLTAENRLSSGRALSAVISLRTLLFSSAIDETD
jgi:hypothetical protein